MRCLRRTGRHQAPDERFSPVRRLWTHRGRRGRTRGRAHEPARALAHRCARSCESRVVGVWLGERRARYRRRCRGKAGMKSNEPLRLSRELSVGQIDTELVGLLGRWCAGTGGLESEPARERGARELAQALLLVVVEEESRDRRIPAASTDRKTKRNFTRPHQRTRESAIERRTRQCESETTKLAARLSRQARLIGIKQRRQQIQEDVAR